MSPILFFIIILVLVFALLGWMLRPDKREEDLQKQLARIAGRDQIEAGGASILKKDNVNEIAWMEELSARLPGREKLRLLIRQSGATWSLGGLLLGSLLAVLLTVIIGEIAGLATLLALAAAVIVGTLPFVYLNVKRKMRFQKFEKAMPDAVDLIARALRAGHAVTSALEIVAQEIGDPVGPEFRIVADEQNLGLPLRDAIMNLTQRIPLDDVNMLATAILVQRETGGNLAEIMDKSANIMRDREKLRGQVQVFTAQGRATGWVLTALPFALGLMINFANHDYEKMLFTDPTGQHIVIGGLIMLCIGALVIRRIVNIKI